MRRRTLQYLEILQICILGVGIELDSRHGHIIYAAVSDHCEKRLRKTLGGVLTEDAVEDLTQRCTVVLVSVRLLPACLCDVPGPALFDFRDVELEEVVQPGDEFLSAHNF
jgi:hypothetical protein